MTPRPVGPGVGPDGRPRPADPPQDIWQHLRDAAAAAGAAPDRFITYVGVAGRTRRIEIFQADICRAESRAAGPGLVLFHGGAWREGGPVQFYRQARVIAEAGFVVALPEYALSEKDGTTPRDAVTDAFLAWSAIRSAARNLGIASDRIFAGGASAGGHLAAALATLAPPRAVVEHVLPAGLILIEPVIDNGPGGYGHSLVEAYWEAFSPLHNIGAVHPDTLILIGDSDPLIPVETASRYCERVRAAKAECDVVIFRNAGHAWFNHDPAGYEGTLTAALDALRIWDRDAKS